MGKVSTSEKILQCAIDMFATKGYDGVAMDVLAEYCGVNKASIYYHYRDKESLYEEAIAQLIRKTGDALEEKVDNTADNPDKLKTFIHTFAVHACEHKTFPAAIMRELASGGEKMPLKIRREMLRILGILKKILDEGEAEGIFRPSNHMVIHFMIIGSINFYVLSQPLRESIETEDSKIAETIKHNNIDAAADEISRIICQSIRKGDV